MFEVLQCLWGMTSQPIPRGDTWQVVFTWLLSNELISRWKLPTITNSKYFCDKHCARPSLRFQNHSTDSKIKPLMNFPIGLCFPDFLFNNHWARLPNRSPSHNEWKLEKAFTQLFFQPFSRITRPKTAELFSSKLDTKSLSTTHQLLQLLNIFSFPSPLTFCIFAKVQGGRRGPSALLSVRKVSREPLWWVGL